MRRIATLGRSSLVPGIVLVAGAMAPFPSDAGPNLNAQLRGAYAFTTARTCTVLVAPNTFGLPPFLIPAIPPPPPGALPLFRQTANDAGIITFNGDGTATATGTSRTMNINATGGPAVTVSEISSTISYNVNPDGTVDTATSTVFSVVFPPSTTTGTATGGTARLQIAHGRNMLVSAPTEDPTVETLLFSVGPSQERLCVRSTTMTKLPGG